MINFFLYYQTNISKNRFIKKMTKFKCIIISHLYFYKNPCENIIDESIKPPYETLKNRFSESETLLCLSVIAKNVFREFD